MVAASVLGPAMLVTGPWLAGGWVVLLDFGPGPLGSGEVFDGGRLPAGPAFTVATALLGALAGERVTALAVAVLLVGLAAGGRSLARALGCGAPAAAVAAVASAWNPFVFDRLHAGQLATVAATAALLGAAAAAIAGRRFEGWLVLAAACSVQFLLYGLVLVLLVSTRPWWRRLRAGAIAVGATALWLVPLVHRAPPSGGAAAAGAFATVADPHLGRALGVAVGSGFWRPPAAPVGAALGSVWPLVAVAALGLAVVGAWSATGRAHRLPLVAAIGWLLAHGSAGPLGWAYLGLLEHVPAAGAFREAHKAAALVVAASVAGVALAVDRVRRLGHWPAVIALGLVLLAAPGLVWGLGGRVDAVAEPGGWAAVRVTLAEADAAQHEVVVLPWATHLRPRLSGGRLVQDPSTSFLVRTATRRTATGIPGTPFQEDDPTARAVADLVATTTDATSLVRAFQDLGVRWLVVVEDGAGVGSAVRWAEAAGLEAVVEGDGVTLYRLVADRPPA